MQRWRVAAALGVAVVLAGCTSGSSDDSAPERDAPRLGAATPTPSAPPEEPMDDLERPVAERLRPRLAGEGLTLEHVECPAWDGTVPSSLRCKGYVDGVVAEVDVELSSDGDDRVEFDAELGAGIVATGRLVARLEEEGYTDVDCGETPAYAARLGMRLVCRVHDDGEPSYVVATVTNAAGAVKIEDY